MKSHSVLVLGDVCVDILSQLPQRKFADIVKDTLIRSGITVRLGGSGMHLALAALDYFAEVSFIGTVGVDALGTIVLSQIRQAGIRSHVGVAADSPTGLVLAIRDASPQPVHGVRLLIAQSKSANHSLTESTIRQIESELPTVRYFVVDGYALAREPRRTAASYAIKKMVQLGATVVLDLVPHDAYELYELSVLKQVVEFVGIVITEVRTIRGFLGLTSPDESTNRALAQDTYNQLARAFPSTAFILRFGIGDVQESLICRPHCEPVHETAPYLETSDSLGFGERLTMEQLSRLFS